MDSSPRTSGPPLHETGARLTIDLSALAANWRRLAACAHGAECAAVVKADAYGLGIAEAVPALSRAGVRTFFVAHTVEGIAVRKAAPDAVIYILNGLPSGGGDAMRQHDLRPVLGDPGEITDWQAGGSGPAALHVDTGMNRLGLTLDQARRTEFRPALLMSHLACADTPDHPRNALQLANFHAFRALFPGVPASLANSAATLTGGDYLFDLCRPGIALYGGNPFANRPNPMAPVVRLEARILQVREVPAGEPVGYGAAEVMTRPSRIAILSAGYADGLHRQAGSTDAARGADAIIGGVRCPFAGRISMDLIAVDVTDAPEAARGGMAVLLGDGIGVDDYARAAGTIGYEVLTGLGRRYHRVYAGG